MVLAILDVKSIQINVHFVRDKLVVLPVMLNFRIVKKKSQIITSVMQWTFLVSLVTSGVWFLIKY